MENKKPEDKKPEEQSFKIKDEDLGEVAGGCINFIHIGDPVKPIISKIDAEIQPIKKQPIDRGDGIILPVQPPVNQELY